MTTTTDIVAKLWRLCDVLRDDGIATQASIPVDFNRFPRSFIESCRSHAYARAMWSWLGAARPALRA